MKKNEKVIKYQRKGNTRDISSYLEGFANKKASKRHPSKKQIQLGSGLPKQKEKISPNNNSHKRINEETLKTYSRHRSFGKQSFENQCYVSEEEISKQSEVKQYNDCSLIIPQYHKPKQFIDKQQKVILDKLRKQRPDIQTQKILKHPLVLLSKGLIDQREYRNMIKGSEERDIDDNYDSQEKHQKVYGSLSKNHVREFYKNEAPNFQMLRQRSSLNPANHQYQEYGHVRNHGLQMFKNQLNLPARPQGYQFISDEEFIYDDNYLSEDDQPHIFQQVFQRFENDEPFDSQPQFHQASDQIEEFHESNPFIPVQKVSGPCQVSAEQFFEGPDSSEDIGYGAVPNEVSNIIQDAALQLNGHTWAGGDEPSIKNPQSYDHQGFRKGTQRQFHRQFFQR